jgi:large conductance mechanosensitive channel
MGGIGMLKEFREFAMRGNVVDMAVGIIIGAAFGKIVSSLVADIIMPPIGVLLGDVDFTEIFINLSGGDYPTLAAAQEAGAATMNVGVFINTVLDFVIVAFAIFLVIRGMNRLKRKEEAPPAEPTTKDCPHCLSEIPIKATRCAHCTAELTAT